MFIRILIVLFLLGVCSAEGVALAAPLRFECNAPAAEFTSFESVEAGPGYVVSGSITGVSTEAHERFAPTATVRLWAAGQSDQLALRMTEDRASNLLQLELLTGAGAQQIRKPLGTARLKEEVPFSIVVKKDTARVQFGARNLDLEIEIGPGAKVEVSCSTGFFGFLGLTWQSVDIPSTK